MPLFTSSGLGLGLVILVLVLRIWSCLHHRSNLLPVVWDPAMESSHGRPAVGLSRLQYGRRQLRGADGRRDRYGQLRVRVAHLRRGQPQLPARLQAGARPHRLLQLLL